MKVRVKLKSINQIIQEGATSISVRVNDKNTLLEVKDNRVKNSITKSMLEMWNTSQFLEMETYQSRPGRTCYRYNRFDYEKEWCETVEPWEPEPLTMEVKVKVQLVKGNCSTCKLCCRGCEEYCRIKAPHVYEIVSFCV